MPKKFPPCTECGTPTQSMTGFCKQHRGCKVCGRLARGSDFLCQLHDPAAQRNQCTVCGAVTASKYGLCKKHNPHKRPRPTNETHAWCNRGEHMVEHAGFAKNQEMCRECRKTHYNDKSNFGMGKTCKECNVRIADTNTTGYCMTHYREIVVEERKRQTQPRRYLNKYGYVVITSQWDHPNADKRGIIREHTMVMAEKLGRPLLPGENVHHINGVRDDNRPENLELWVRSQPSGQRLADLVDWAREIIRRYG